MRTKLHQPQAVHRVRREVFESEYLGRETPVIVTDALYDWKAINTWSPEYLASVLKHKRAIVAVSKEDKFNCDPSGQVGRQASHFRHETLDFITIVSRILKSDSTSERYYVMQTSIPDEFPELLRDIKIPTWVGSNKTAINLWFGTANNVTPLHHDSTNNFFAQIYGRKRITLFDPSQTEWLYPYPVHVAMNHISFVDIENPDLMRYPEYRKAQPMECLLGPGELLYIPAYWWHHVRSVDVSISVNIWWPPMFQQLLSPNAIRALPKLYEKNVLKDVKKILAGANLDFLQGAVMLYSKNQKWAAVLLAGAALDEYVRKLSRDHGLAEEEGDTFNPIIAINSKLQTANVYSREDAKRVTVWIEMINQALAGDNNKFSDAGVSSFIGEIRSFIS